jgi:hypothetical protein
MLARLANFVNIRQSLQLCYCADGTTNTAFAAMVGFYHFTES